MLSETPTIYNQYTIDTKQFPIEAFEKCSILFKAKKGANFNHRHTLSISRIKI